MHILFGHFEYCDQVTKKLLYIGNKEKRHAAPQNSKIGWVHIRLQGPRHRACKRALNKWTGCVPLHCSHTNAWLHAIAPVKREYEQWTIQYTCAGLLSASKNTLAVYHLDISRYTTRIVGNPETWERVKRIRSVHCIVTYFFVIWIELRHVAF